MVATLRKFEKTHVRLDIFSRFLSEVRPLGRRERPSAGDTLGAGWIQREHCAAMAVRKGRGGGGRGCLRSSGCPDPGPVKMPSCWAVAHDGLAVALRASQPPTISIQRNRVLSIWRRSGNMPLSSCTWRGRASAATSRCQPLSWTTLPTSLNATKTHSSAPARLRLSLSPLLIGFGRRSRMARGGAAGRQA